MCRRGGSKGPEHVRSPLHWRGAARQRAALPPLAAPSSHLEHGRHTRRCAQRTARQHPARHRDVRYPGGGSPRRTPCRAPCTSALAPSVFCRAQEGMPSARPRSISLPDQAVGTVSRQKLPASEALSSGSARRTLRRVCLCEICHNHLHRWKPRVDRIQPRHLRFCSGRRLPLLLCALTLEFLLAARQELSLDACALTGSTYSILDHTGKVQLHFC